MPNNFGNTPWSLSQVEFLKKNYAKRGQAFCAAYLHKSENAVRCKARTLKIQRQKETWTEREVEILRGCWQHTSFREMYEALRPHTAIAIKHKAYKLGLGPRHSHMVSILQGCKLLGVCAPEFKRIVALANVNTLRDRSHRIHRYDKAQVLAAGKDYFRRETAMQAAERLGWNYSRLRVAASKLGALKIADEYKMYPEEWDSLCQKWEAHVRECHVAAAKRLRQGYHVRFVARARKILESLGYYVSPVPCTAPTLTSPDTGNALSTN